jgi:hypothetical protein
MFDLTRPSVLTTVEAITAMARALRTKKYETGLILANGGMLTHQHALCLSARPRRDGSSYPKCNPLPAIVDEYSPSFTEIAQGTATIEVRFSDSVTYVRIVVID